MGGWRQPSLKTPKNTINNWYSLKKKLNLNFQSNAPWNAKRYGNLSFCLRNAAISRWLPFGQPESGHGSGAWKFQGGQKKWQNRALPSHPLPFGKLIIFKKFIYSLKEESQSIIIVPKRCWVYPRTQYTSTLEEKTMDDALHESRYIPRPYELVWSVWRSSW